MVGPDDTKQVAPTVGRDKLPSYWASFFARFVTLLYALLVLAVLVTTGKMLVPFRHFPDVTFSQSSLVFLLGAAVNAWIVLVAWFHAPYQRWSLMLRLPPDPKEPLPDDSYAGYKHPPRNIGPLHLEPLHLSDILNSALANSFLWMLWIFGAMTTLAGLAQLFYGTFYVGHDGALEIVDYADDPKQFSSVVLVYAAICAATVLLGLLLYFWGQIKAPRLRLNLNLGKRPGGNLH